MRSIGLNWIWRCIMYALGVLCVLLLGGLASAYSESSTIMSIIHKCYCFSFDNAVYFLILHYIALNIYVHFLEKEIAIIQKNGSKNDD